ncbi:MAG: hypothetical protein LBB74_02860 [Chitinispirillales bacterium]|jgi:uncharacterized membrane protein affecting hemolysin expression|nr:hypothetical protein [Chitinispirillales bacterium]
MEDAGNDIAANVARQAVGAMMGDISSIVEGVALLIAVAVGLFLTVLLFSRKRRRERSKSGRRKSSRSKKSSRRRSS